VTDKQDKADYLVVTANQSGWGLTDFHPSRVIIRALLHVHAFSAHRTQLWLEAEGGFAPKVGQI
jgi:hypothetical protein